MTKKRRRFMSKADDILDLIKNFSNKKGYVKGLDSEVIAKKLDYSPHDVSKLLFDLQKRGLLGFSTNQKQGKDGTLLLYRLRLTKQGIDAVHVNEDEPTPLPEETPFAIEPEVATPPGTPPTPPTPPTPTLPTYELPPPPPGIDRTKMTPYEEWRLQTPPRARYPLLTSLLDRKRLAEQASMNLEALGADELALQALALADAPLTPLQKEIAQFFVDHPGFVKFAVAEGKS